jgi:hypothetical protein
LIRTERVSQNSVKFIYTKWLKKKRAVTPHLPEIHILDATVTSPLKASVRKAPQGCQANKHKEEAIG